MLTKLIIAAIVIVAGFFIVRSLIPPDPLKPDKSFRITIDSSRAQPDSIRITNNSDVDLMLHVFNASDVARIVPRAELGVRRGQWQTYPRGSYVFNVWKDEIADKHLKWTEEIWSDVVLAGSENNLDIQTKPKPPVTFSNDVDEGLKVAVYDAKDAAQAVPLQWWPVGAGRVIEWKGGPPRFILKVFRPGAVDQLLAMEADVPEMSAIRISKGPWWKFW